MTDSNETIAYENGRDAGYAEGYEDALAHAAKVIVNVCGSDALATPIKELLCNYKISFTEINGDSDGYESIVQDVLTYLERR